MVSFKGRKAKPEFAEDRMPRFSFSLWAKKKARPDVRFYGVRGIIEQRMY
jgi:hypothetical protein